MKFFLAALATAFCAGAWAQPAQRVVDLRRVLEQYHPASAPQGQPRQLTPDERAQLRRQLADFKQAVTPRQTSEGPTPR